MPRTGLHVQLCGDAHLSNFGAYAAPDRQPRLRPQRLRRDAAGPVRVGREAAGGQLRRRRPGPGFRCEAAQVGQHRGRRARTGRRCRSFAGMGTLDLWYARIEVDQILEPVRQSSSKRLKRVERNVAKARSKDSIKAFGKLTEMVDGEPRIVSDPPLIVPIEEVAPPGELHRLDDFIRGVIRSYRRTLTADRRRAARALPLCPRGAQGRRRGQRRNPRLDHAAARPRCRAIRCSFSSRRRRRPCSSPSWARAGHQSRPAGRGGPAADAGGQRHHARLGARHATPRASTATPTSASSGTRRAPRRSTRWIPRP